MPFCYGHFNSSLKYELIVFIYTYYHHHRQNVVCPHRGTRVYTGKTDLYIVHLPKLPYTTRLHWLFRFWKYPMFTIINKIQTPPWFTEFICSTCKYLLLLVRRRFSHSGGNGGGRGLRRDRLALASQTRHERVRVRAARPELHRGTSRGTSGTNVMRKTRIESRFN